MHIPLPQIILHRWHIHAPDIDGSGNIAGSGVYNGPLQLQIAAKFPTYPNIFRAKLYALLLAIEQINTCHQYVYLHRQPQQHIHATQPHTPPTPPFK